MPTPDTIDTFVAISIPPGRGGIGIVRLAGPDALDGERDTDGGDEEEGLPHAGRQVELEVPQDRNGDVGGQARKKQRPPV